MRVEETFGALSRNFNVLHVGSLTALAALIQASKMLACCAT